jgi:ribosomal protein S25
MGIVDPRHNLAKEDYARVWRANSQLSRACVPRRKRDGIKSIEQVCVEDRCQEVRKNVGRRSLFSATLSALRRDVSSSFARSAVSGIM